MQDPWSNPDSFEPEPVHFKGVRELSGVILASLVVVMLLIWGILKASHVL